MNGMHMFAGVNTPSGFFSYFNFIMDETEKSRKIFLKGGPGTGKSTLMKRIAKKAEALHLPYEVFHCSSDPASYDGVHIPSLKTAVIDATSPHNDDPKYPRAGGEIFDAATFLTKGNPALQGEEIRFYAEKKRRAFQNGYHFLEAALPLLTDMENEYKAAADLRGIKEVGEDIANRIFGISTCKGNGHARCLFASAITPEGFVNYVDTIFSDSYVITVKGAYGASVVMQRFAELAMARGFTPILFFCPMQPQKKLEHVYIPQLKTALSTYDYYTNFAGAEMVDLDEFIRYDPHLGDGWSYAGTLMQRAIDSFAEAKAAHGYLESIYVPCMDFEAMEKKTEELVQSIF